EKKCSMDCMITSKNEAAALIGRGYDRTRMGKQLAPEGSASTGCDECCPLLQGYGIDLQFQPVVLPVQGQHVAVGDFADQTAVTGFWRDVNSGGKFSRGTGHPAIRQQRYLESLILQ